LIASITEVKLRYESKMNETANGKSLTSRPGDSSLAPRSPPVSG
jgi:hypothetical protein